MIFRVDPPDEGGNDRSSRSKDTNNISSYKYVSGNSEQSSISTTKLPTETKPTNICNTQPRKSIPISTTDTSTKTATNVCVLNSFSYTNIQGLCPQTLPSKVPYIEDILFSFNQIFIALSETWLKSHKEAELFIKGYTLFPTDSSRQKKSNKGRLSGGVAFYIREDIAGTFEPLFEFISDSIQALCLFSEKENLLCVVYRQPDDKAHGHPSTSYEFKKMIKDLRESVFQLEILPDIVICGDFNLPHIKWPEGDPLPKASKEERKMIELVNELCNDLCLSQLITSATHKDGNILDLVLCNYSEFTFNNRIEPTTSYLSSFN